MRNYFLIILKTPPINRIFSKTVNVWCFTDDGSGINLEEIARRAEIYVLAKEDLHEAC